MIELIVRIAGIVASVINTTVRIIQICIDIAA